jgi:hypothetical protein
LKPGFRSANYRDRKEEKKYPMYKPLCSIFFIYFTKGSLIMEHALKIGIFNLAPLSHFNYALVKFKLCQVWIIDYYQNIQYL